MATLGKWFFRFKGSASSTVFEGYADGCSNDVPGVISEPSSGCYDGNVYHIVATARSNARYATSLAFSTCGSGALSILEATFTSDATVTGITCAPDAPAIKYDCINGACLPNTTYSTPGIYNTLAECETACGPGCSGVCVSNDDWAKIKGLSEKLRQKNCS